jgi:hypothetical protein
MTCGKLILRALDTVERGRGYVPAEKREPEALPIHAILLDADFSPVQRVNFHVEPAADGKEAAHPQREDVPIPPAFAIRGNVSGL